MELKTCNLQLTLFDGAFVLASFVLLGTGIGIMANNGFDFWFAYLLALPSVGAVAKLRSAYR